MSRGNKRKIGKLGGEDKRGKAWVERACVMNSLGHRLIEQLGKVWSGKFVEESASRRAIGSRQMDEGRRAEKRRKSKG